MAQSTKLVLYKCYMCRNNIVEGETYQIVNTHHYCLPCFIRYFRSPGVKKEDDVDEG